MIKTSAPMGSVTSHPFIMKNPPNNRRINQPTKRQTCWYIRKLFVQKVIQRYIYVCIGCHHPMYRYVMILCFLWPPKAEIPNQQKIYTSLTREKKRNASSKISFVFIVKNCTFFCFPWFEKKRQKRNSILWPNKGNNQVIRGKGVHGDFQIGVVLTF